MNALLLVALGAALFCALAITMFSRSLSAVPGGESPIMLHVREVDRDLKRIAVWAFAARLLVGVVMWTTRWGRILAPDSSFYTEFGKTLADEVGRPDSAAFWEFAMRTGQGRFAAVNGVVFYVFGSVPYLMIAVAALAGAFTVILSGRIAATVGGPTAGRIAAWMVALFPSLVLWSSLNLRDPYLVLAIVGAVWATVRLKDSFGPIRLVQVGICLVVIAVFRDYLFAVVASGIAVGLLLGSRGNRVGSLLGAALVAAVLVIAVGRIGVGGWGLADVNLAEIQAMRDNFGWGASSAYLVGYDISTVEGLSTFLPLGLAYFLFAPFPWMARGLLQSITIPEMLLWYFLMPHVARGVRFVWGTNRREMWVLIALAGAMALTYALISGNMGTAYRHRAQVLPLLLVFASVGWARYRERKYARDAGTPITVSPFPEPAEKPFAIAPSRTLPVAASSRL